MQLDASKLQPFLKPELWIRLTSGILLVLSLYLLAKLVWLWVDAYNADYKIPVVKRATTSTPTQSRQVSVAGIVNQHLFGDASAKPVEQKEEAVAASETRLPLKLKGIYAADDKERASAIIESGNQQQVYFIGESITGGQGAVLHQVQPEKVILNTSGRYESLTLEQEESVIQVNPERRKSEDDRASRREPESQTINNPRITRELNELRHKIQENPENIRDLMKWEPVMENGELKGVKISPGKARRLFYELKLRRNDIVTNINGMSLNDPSQLLMLQDSLTTANEVNLTVLRNGQAQEIRVTLDSSKARQ